MPTLKSATVKIDRQQFNIRQFFIGRIGITAEALMITAKYIIIAGAEVVVQGNEF